jgi:hypothetical protein
MGFHVRTKSLNRSSHLRGSVTVAAHKFRRRTKCQVENVVEHEDLAVALAQFEREVTGERIRDKIAASKKRGI